MVSNPSAPGTGAPATGASQTQQHPAVAKAGLFHSIAEALAGGPRTITKVGPDGVPYQTKVPLSGRQIGLAIALEALTGGMAGLGAKGPNHLGQAAQLGLQQGEKIQQQRSAQQQQDFDNAQKSFTDKASAFAANLKTHNATMEVGMRDEQAHKDFVAAHAPTAQTIRTDYSGAIIGDNLTEDQVKDPEFVKKLVANGWVGIPIGYTPRFDPTTGSHYAPNGTPMNDSLFMVVDAGKLGKMAVPPESVASYQKWNLPGFTDSLGQPMRGLDDLELRLGTVTNLNNQVNNLEIEQKDLTDYYGYLSSKGIKGADGQPLVAPTFSR